MRRFWDVVAGVAWRSIKKFATNPQLLLPSVIFPLFFFVAFAGGLSSVGNVPGFDFPSGYTAFQFVFVLLQASAFGGVWAGASARKNQASKRREITSGVIQREKSTSSSSAPRIG